MIVRKLPERPPRPPASRLPAPPTRLKMDIQGSVPSTQLGLDRVESDRARADARAHELRKDRSLGSLVGTATCGAALLRSLRGPIHRQRRSARQARATRGTDALLGARRRPRRGHRSTPSRRSSNGSKPGASRNTKRPAEEPGRQRHVGVLAPHPGRRPAHRARARRRAMPLRGPAGSSMHRARHSRVPSPDTRLATAASTRGTGSSSRERPGTVTDRDRLRSSGFGPVSAVEYRVCLDLRATRSASYVWP